MLNAHSSRSFLYAKKRASRREKSQEWGGDGDINNGVKMFQKEKRNEKFDVFNKVKKNKKKKHGKYMS